MQSRSSNLVVSASPIAVWSVLTDPALTRSFVLGLAVESTFAVGADIRFHGPGGVLLGGRILAHEHARLLSHSLGDMSGDLLRCGLEDQDPTCWVTWTVESVTDDATSTRVELTVDVFDDDEDVFTAWAEALSGLARVLSA